MNQSDSVNTSWRKVAASIYKKPTDSKIFGSVELDVTDLEHYIAQKRKEGLKITLTHIFTLAVARALKDGVPELNAYVRRGGIVKRKSIDAMVSVLIGDSQMGSIKVHNADTLTLKELADIMDTEIRKARAGRENKTMKMRDSVTKIPWPFRVWLVSIIRKITIDWGLTIPFLNFKPDSFGSYVVSNIGTLGLDMGYPALFPISNVPLVLIMGGVKKRPHVVNDSIVPRRIIYLGAALDHRVVDAMHGGKLFKYIKHVTSNPSILESKPV